MAESFFITGATGTQGGATVDALLKLNESRSASSQFNIHIIVRDPSTAPAQRLASLGPAVKIFQGDFDSVSALTVAAKDCSAAFINVSPSFTDAEAEQRHARNIIAACKAAGTVKRIIYSGSSAMACPEPVWRKYIEDNPGAFMGTYMISKNDCETAVKQAASEFLSEGSTILRPAVFYQNFVSPTSQFMYPTLASEQTITTGLRPDKINNCLDPGDIGAFAAKLMTDPNFTQRWAGKIVPMASVNMTMSQIVDKINANIQKLSDGKSSKEVKLVQLSDEELAAAAAKGDVWTAVFRFQNDCMPPYDLEKDVFPVVGDEIRWTTWDEFFQKNQDKFEAAVGGF